MKIDLTKREVNTIINGLSCAIDEATDDETIKTSEILKKKLERYSR